MKFSKDMNFLYMMIFTLSVFSFSGLAYAQPLETISTTVVEYDHNQAIVSISWNYDQTAASYEIGCVSCMPNVSKSVTSESITMLGIAPLPNTHTALLYLIAYDSEGEINNAKQILINLEI